MLPSTLSRWLGQLLTMASVDAKAFNVLSTQSAAPSSKAEVTAVSLTDIIKQSHGSQTSTFQKFDIKISGNTISVFNQESSTRIF